MLQNNFLMDNILQVKTAKPVVYLNFVYRWFLFKIRLKQYVPDEFYIYCPQEPGQNIQTTSSDVTKFTEPK